MLKDELKDYPSLIKFIISERIGMNQKQIAKEMGVSWASFVGIKQGELVPGENLANKIAGYMKNNFNITFKYNGNKLIVDKKTDPKIIQTHREETGYDKYLLERVISLSIENEKLKMELSKFK